MWCLIVLLFFVSIVSGQHICPDSSDFKPCTCDIEGINCNYALDSGEVRQAFKTYSQDAKFKNLWISHTDITEINNDTFGKYQFRKLSLQYNQIEVVEIEAFATMAGFIFEIDLSHNRLKVIPNFSGMTSLISLRLEVNYILKVDVFPSLPKLITLGLQSNQIGNIAPKAFATLPTIMVLDLSGNRLQAVGNYAFQRTNLESSTDRILLNNNEITTIAPTAFDGQHELTGLSLAGNRIETFNVDFWEPFLKRINSTETKVVLNDNPIKCSVSNLKWILDYPESLKTRLLGVFCDEKHLSGLTIFDLQ